MPSTREMSTVSIIGQKGKPRSAMTSVLVWRTRLKSELMCGLRIPVFHIEFPPRSGNNLFQKWGQAPRLAIFPGDSCVGSEPVPIFVIGSKDLSRDDEIGQFLRAFLGGRGFQAIEFFASPASVVDRLLLGIEEIASQRSNQGTSNSACRSLGRPSMATSSARCDALTSPSRRMIGSVGFCFAKSVPSDLPVTASLPRTSSTSSMI